jgi:hypothetical protein
LQASSNSQSGLAATNHNSIEMLDISIYPLLDAFRTAVDGSGWRDRIQDIDVSVIRNLI